MKYALVFALAVAVLSSPALSQVDDPTLPGDTTAGGLGREQMWKAPTVEDWAKPVLITFQRSWADALVVAKETGKPIMACINMDGEIASEHYAGVRYRQADVAALYEPFVCVVASVYRHSPRDYDGAGNRVLCPRLGSVTCGEHMALEPILYAMYLDEARVSPRHIVIEADGSESDDVYYANDTASVFRVIRDSAKGRPPARDPRRWDMPVELRAGSSNVDDRDAVEGAFRKGDLNMRRRLIVGALESGIDQTDLWRLALKSGQADIAKLGLEGLKKSTDAGSLDLIVETMAQLDGDELAGDREMLVEVLDKIGEGSDRARTLASSYRSLDQRSEAVDRERVGARLAASGNIRKRTQAMEVLESLDPRLGGAGYGGEAVEPLSDAHQALARAVVELEMAQSPEVSEEYRSYYMADGVRDLEAARGLLGTEDAWRWELVDIAHKLWVAPGVVSIQAAETRAEKLVPNLPAEATREGGMALRDVMAAFMRARHRSIRNAIRLKQEWPSSWMADARAAFAAIAEAPRSGAYDYLKHLDFLRFMGAFRPSEKVLTRGLERFPLDPELHQRLRGQLLWGKSLDAIDGLEAHYAGLVAAANLPAPGGEDLRWYAGLASRMVAEELRKAGRSEDARGAYARARDYFWWQTPGAQPGTWFRERTSQSHFQYALCLYGLARLDFEAGHNAGAVAHLVDGFSKSPSSANHLDGVGATGVTTAQLMQGQGLEPELAASLAAAMQKLHEFDPSLFDLVEYEVNSAGKPAVGLDKK